jgi:hypothetical protein
VLTASVSRSGLARGGWYPYQQEGIRATRRAAQGNDRCPIFAATGETRGSDLVRLKIQHSALRVCIFIHLVGLQITGTISRIRYLTSRTTRDQVRSYGLRTACSGLAVQLVFGSEEL